jgi:hypothetical protein
MNEAVELAKYITREKPAEEFYAELKAGFLKVLMLKKICNA